MDLSKSGNNWNRPKFFFKTCQSSCVKKKEVFQLLANDRKSGISLGGSCQLAGSVVYTDDWQIFDSIHGKFSTKNLQKKRKPSKWEQSKINNKRDPSLFYCWFYFDNFKFSKPILELWSFSKTAFFLIHYFFIYFST